jgi:3-oxoacid CoA-transferase B subunit
LSFGIARGGHLDLIFLEAMQVSGNGDIANWIIPGKTIRGMSGDMDLANSGNKIVALTEHVSLDGKQKLVSFCKYPLTAKGVVDMIITDKAVFERKGE